MSEEVQEQQEAQEPKEEQAVEAAEETQSVQEAEAPAQEAVTQEAPAGEDTQEQGEKKKAKINRLTLDELNSRIADMEKKNLTHAIYYKHLNQRKRELEAS